MQGIPGILYNQEANRYALVHIHLPKRFFSHKVKQKPFEVLACSQTPLEDLREIVLSLNRSFLFFEIALATDHHKNPPTISFSAASEGVGDVTLGLTHFLSFRKNSSKVLSTELKTSMMSGQVCLLKKGHCWEEQTSVWGLKLGGLRLTDTQFHQEGLDR